MGDFNMDSILLDTEVENLFLEDAEETKAPSEEPKETKDTNESKDTDSSTEVDPEDLFEEDTQETPESVGNDEDEKKQQEGPDSDKQDKSPDTNFYSSIASALKEEGALPDLDDAEIEATVEPEDFVALIKRQVQAQLDETTKRVSDALNNGVEPSVINSYEKTLSYLNGITEDLIKEESEEGENIRKRLIQQDFMNRGYTPERAVKLTDKFFQSGDDIEEALAALTSNKEYYQNQYDTVLANAQKEKQAEDAALKKQGEALKKSIMDNETVLGSIQIDKKTRQKVYDNAMRPVYKDADGNYLTALQKYKSENENDFIRYMSLFYTLTNGFTDMSNIIKPQAKKEMKSKLRELENTLNGNTKLKGGNMKMVGLDTQSQSGSVFDKGYSIDL